MGTKNHSKFKEKAICQRSTAIEVASRWLGDGKAKAQGKGMGRGAIACHRRHASFLEFTYVFRLSVLTWKVANKYPYCVYEFLYMSHFLHLFSCHTHI